MAFLYLRAWGLSPKVNKLRKPKILSLFCVQWIGHPMSSTDSIPLCHRTDRMVSQDSMGISLSELRIDALLKYYSLVCRKNTINGSMQASISFLHCMKTGSVVRLKPM